MDIIRTDDSEGSARVRAAIQVWLHAKQQSRRTREAYHWTINTFRRALWEQGLDLDCPESEKVALVAQAWAARPSPHHPERPPTSTTHNHRLAAVSSFYTFALRRKLLPLTTGNPIETVDRRSVQEYASARPIPFARIQERLAAIDTRTFKGARDHAFLSVGLVTGRRLSELLALTLGDVEEEPLGDSERPSRLVLTFRLTKGGKTFRDALPDVAARSLRRWLAVRCSSQEGAVQIWQTSSVQGVASSLPVWISLAHNGTWGQRMTRQAVSQMCQRRLGTSRVHALRHTFAHAMEEAGARTGDIQAKLGHTSSATTDRYLQRLRSDFNPYGEAVAALYGLMETTETGEE